MSETANVSEIGPEGVELYEDHICAVVEPGNVGRFVVIDFSTGDYEVGDDRLALADHMFARHAKPTLHGLRIGFPVVGYVRSASRETEGIREEEA